MWNKKNYLEQKINNVEQKVNNVKQKINNLKQKINKQKNVEQKTRSKCSIFKLTIDSMLNQLANISACHVSTRAQTTSNTVMKAESQSTNFLQ